MKWLLRSSYDVIPLSKYFDCDTISQWHILRPDDGGCAVSGVYKRNGKWWVFNSAHSNYEEVPEVKTLEEAKAYAEISYRMFYPT